MHVAILAVWQSMHPTELTADSATVFSGNGEGHINEVTLCQASLIQGW